MGKFILMLLLLLQVSYTQAPGEMPGKLVDQTTYHEHYMELMEQKWEREPVTVDEQVRVLESLGLNLSKETVDETQAFWEGDKADDYWPILAFEGVGESHQVYTPEVERYSLGGMYETYLQGLQRISQEELTFSDVTEDFSRVNYEEPGGTVKVCFKLNGEDCHYEAAFMGDWLDLTIREEINRCLAKQGVEKRFYATDGADGEIIFFCTKEWAEEFEAATLCCMTDFVL